MNKLYIQGGPGRAIANIGAKKFTGELSFPIRVDRDNILEPAVKTILQHAENPMYSLTLDTNHMLSYSGLTAENGGKIIKVAIKGGVMELQNNKIIVLAE